MQILEAYAVLGVRQSATRRDIDAAWRMRARAWHPDRCPGDPRAVRRMQVINAARRVLRRRIDDRRCRTRRAEDEAPRAIEPRSALDALVAMPMPRRTRVRGLVPQGQAWELHRSLRGHAG